MIIYLSFRLSFGTHLNNIEDSLIRHIIFSNFIIVSLKSVFILVFRILFVGLISENNKESRVGNVKTLILSSILLILTFNSSMLLSVWHMNDNFLYRFTCPTRKSGNEWVVR